MAIVGAYVLAGGLAAAGGDHVVAFAEYEAAMRPFVAVNQKMGRSNAAVSSPRSRLGIFAQVVNAIELPRWLAGTDQVHAAQRLQGQCGRHPLCAACKNGAARG